MTGNHHEKNNNKMRVFDDDGYRQRAACICVRNQYEDEVRKKDFHFIFILLFLFKSDFINNISS
jgi:hypothetical protein